MCVESEFQMKMGIIVWIEIYQSQSNAFHFPFQSNTRLHIWNAFWQCWVTCLSRNVRMSQKTFKRSKKIKKIFSFASFLVNFEVPPMKSVSYECHDNKKVAQHCPYAIAAAARAHKPNKYPTIWSAARNMPKPTLIMILPCVQLRNIQLAHRRKGLFTSQTQILRSNHMSKAYG